MLGKKSHAHHTHTHTQTYTHTHTLTHTTTRAHTHADTHSHTHTHAPLYTHTQPANEPNQRVYYLLPVPTMDIYIYNCITDAPTRVGVSAPNSGSFDIAFAKLIKS